MNKSFDFYKGKIRLKNGPGCYKITEDPLWLLSVLPLNKSSYLEVGCATGVLSLILRLKNSTAKIKAIDIQKEMIQQAKQHAKENNIEDIDFQLQDLYTLKEGEKYDCVFSNPPFFDNAKCDFIKDNIKNLAYLQTDISSYIKKLLQLVKNGGHVCFVGHCSIRSDILYELKNKVNLKEIKLISSESKPAKRFIYIVEKNNRTDFESYVLDSFDKEIRKDILFLYNSISNSYLKKD
ncbi:MAG TPA: hypothetical protein DCL21_00905 [Alphaproteobacteria bacterium]|nr:hypothetical protein [Alphaproteobacteria bacterium]